MSRKGNRQQYQKRPFESDCSSSDIFAGIYMSMLTSEAWMNLTANQQRLYLYCKAQYYDEKKKPIEGDRESFTMNQHKWMTKYKLYKRGNESGFYRDMEALISHGFVTCFARGGNGCFKNIYRFSSMWQKYGTDSFKLTPSDMTAQMHRKSLKKGSTPQA